MTAIIPVRNKEKYKTVTALAHTIWTDHYTPIIGKQQVAYMLDKFQSEQAIKAQVEAGIHYYLIEYQDAFSGYFSFSITDEHLFLSKLYVDKSLRGKGLGKAALMFIESKAKELGLDRIRLTVNKYNANSIKAYEKMGFKNIDSIVQDIGNGYVMDDYELEKNI